MSQITLRPYQQNATQAVVDGFKNGIHRQLLILPTGTGKTIVFAAITKQINKKTLILAHRNELIEQASAKIKLFDPEADIGLCKGTKNDIEHTIVIGSIQTCSQKKRLAQLKKQCFNVLIIDEAHHATAKSYQTVIKALGFMDNKKKLMVGVTATPQRSDKKHLGDTFERIIYEQPISKFIQHGYLTPVIGRKILTTTNINNVRTKMGDFVIPQLAEAVNTPERNKFIVEKYKAYTNGRKSIAFCVDVKHCTDLTETFCNNAVRSAAIYGSMDPKERTEILNKFHDGQLDVVTSCGVLTEGYDETSISAILMCRPTKSKTLYTQCVGRGLRPHVGKENCIVLDFTDKSHNIDSIVSLSKAIPEATIVHEEKPKQPYQRISNQPEIYVRKSVDQEFDGLGNSRLLWVNIDDGEWSLASDDGDEIIIRPVHGGFVADICQKGMATRTLFKSPLPLDYCRGACEDFARDNFSLNFAKISEWKNKNEKSTQQQLQFLRQKGVKGEDMSKSEAAVAIRTIIALERKQRREVLAKKSSAFFHRSI